ncbi:MAG: septation protein IspZ, partial [Alphaproteobacteria bacterium]|nr:septation protein IspZ [Alphaproteobacteria bacterium]
MTDTTLTPATPSLTKLAIDLGPLVIFVAAYVLSKNPFIATGAFMVAMVAAIIVAKIKLGSIPLLLIFSCVMVIVFGGLTIALHDQRFIQIKPSIYYASVSAILFYGGYTKRPFLKHVLGDAYPELS